MIIRVTQEHIDKGIRGSCTKCPIALALIDAGLDNPSVGVYYMRGGGRHLFGCPQIIKNFMTLFDNGAYAAPFEFEIPDAA